MQKILNLCIVLFVGIILSGCASIILGTTQKVPVNSTPDGAKVTVYDGNNTVIGGGSTPCSLSLSRGSGFFSSAKYRVVIEKPGYEKREVRITGSVNGWYIAGNLLFGIGSVLGWLIIDPATGAMWSLNPEDVNASLPAGSSSLLRADKCITVALYEQTPPVYRSKMNLIQAKAASTH